MRRVSIVILCGLQLLTACQSTDTLKEGSNEEKSCACQEPSALNGVSIDLPQEFLMDNVQGDSVQNRIVYRNKHEFVYFTVRCGDCDTLKRNKAVLQSFLPTLLRDSIPAEVLHTKKYKGRWYEAEKQGVWACEYFLAGVGPKDWYVQIRAENVGRSTLRKIREAVSTIEIREKASEL